MRDCCRMAKTEVKPNMKQAVPCVASPCKRIITTKTMTSEPRLSQSESVQGFDFLWSAREGKCFVVFNVFMLLCFEIEMQF